MDETRAPPIQNKKEEQQMERKNVSDKRMSIIVFVVVLTTVLGFAAFIHAALVTYQFSGTVTSVDSVLSDFPDVLQGLQAGDSIVGSYSYDGATAPSTNPFSSGVYKEATFYEVPNTFSLAIKGTSIPIGGSMLQIFVWNNFDPLGSGGSYDGYTVQNTFTRSLPYYLNFGNIIYPSATFDDESLPVTSLPGGVFGFHNSSLSATYLEASFGTLVPTNPVPLPPSLFLLAPGLVGLVIARRKYKR